MRRKRGDTKVGTVEETYGKDFHVRSDMKLRTLLRQRKATSLTQLLRQGTKGSRGGARIPERRKTTGRRTEMTTARAFISFDFDHDEDLRVMLAGQAKHPDTPFEFADWSVKQPMTGDWKEKVRARIRKTDLTIVICGKSTHTATGVAAELAITKEEGKPYFLLTGRADGTCTKPTGAGPGDKMYKWTWDNLKALIGGAR